MAGSSIAAKKSSRSCAPAHLPRPAPARLRTAATKVVAVLRLKDLLVQAGPHGLIAHLSRARSPTSRPCRPRRSQRPAGDHPPENGSCTRRSQGRIPSIDVGPRRARENLLCGRHARPRTGRSSCSADAKSIALSPA